LILWLFRGVYFAFDWNHFLLWGNWNLDVQWLSFTPVVEVWSNVKVWKFKIITIDWNPKRFLLLKILLLSFDILSSKILLSCLILKLLWCIGYRIMRDFTLLFWQRKTFYFTECAKLTFQFIINILCLHTWHFYSFDELLLNVLNRSKVRLVTTIMIVFLFPKTSNGLIIILLLFIGQETIIVMGLVCHDVFITVFIVIYITNRLNELCFELHD